MLDIVRPNCPDSNPGEFLLDSSFDVLQARISGVHHHHDEGGARPNPHGFACGPLRHLGFVAKGFRLCLQNAEASRDIIERVIDFVERITSTESRLFGKSRGPHAQNRSLVVKHLGFPFLQVSKARSSIDSPDRTLDSLQISIAEHRRSLHECTYADEGVMKSATYFSSSGCELVREVAEIGDTH